MVCFCCQKIVFIPSVTTCKIIDIVPVYYSNIIDTNLSV